MSSLKCVRIPTGGAIAGLEPTDYIAPEMLRSGDPQERGRSLYADQTGQLDAGVWECEPNRHVLEAAPYDEFVYLLARPELATVSSTLVRDVARHGGELSRLVPPEVAQALQAHFTRGD